MTPDNVLRESFTNKHGVVVTVRRCKACRYASGRAPVPNSRGQLARDLAETFHPIMRERYGWEERGACRGEPVEKFVPNSPTTDLTPVRDSFCTRCPVAKLCLARGLSYPDTIGVWGGYILPKEIRKVDHEKLLKEIQDDEDQ